MTLFEFSQIDAIETLLQKENSKEKYSVDADGISIYNEAMGVLRQSMCDAGFSESTHRNFVVGNAMNEYPEQRNYIALKTDGVTEIFLAECNSTGMTLHGLVNDSLEKCVVIKPATVEYQYDVEHLNTVALLSEAEFSLLKEKMEFIDSIKNYQVCSAELYKEVFDVHKSNYNDGVILDDRNYSFIKSETNGLIGLFYSYEAMEAKTGPIDDIHNDDTALLVHSELYKHNAYRLSAIEADSDSKEIPLFAESVLVEICTSNNINRQERLAQKVQAANEIHRMKSLCTTLYGEASLEENVKRLFGKAKELPGDIAKTYKSFLKNVKTKIAKIRKAKKDEEREEILNKEYLPLLSIAISNIIPALAVGGLVATGLIGPFLGILAFFTKVVVSVFEDSKKRARAAKHIKDEMAILDEKIEDARSNGEKEKKYQLIRTKKELEKVLLDVRNG